MRILTQIGIVLVVCLVGELVAQVLPFPFPSSVIAMVLLFLLLCSKVIKPYHIQGKTDFLLKNMAFFFIPAGVGILENFDALRQSLLPFLLVCVLTTIITFFAAAMTVKGVMALQRKNKGGQAE